MRDKSTKKSRKRSFGGVLWIIGLMFFGSALLRLGGGLGQAIASQNQPNVAQNISGTSTPALLDEKADALLQALLEREKRIAEKEAALEMREQENALLRRKVEEGLKALVQAEEDLAATMARADGAEEADLARLTAVYENMKPKAAAPLFEQMDPEFAAGFLGRMRPDAAAAIIAGLDPQAAYSISVILANRNREVPKN